MLKKKKEDEEKGRKKERKKERKVFIICQLGEWDEFKKCWHEHIKKEKKKNNIEGGKTLTDINFPKCFKNYVMAAK